ncbi:MULTISPECIES: ABC transporter permease [Erwiniaceae]|uniref:ABC transporter permease n=1 Tax=Enterobacter agglomerans TaxID=549 RepID=A0ACC5RL48_ENTAG|nr:MULTISPECIES: ABC transporter permease [Erwiniaceae]MBK4725389.1 ABC transporter permease [Pantoea agglomerans]MBP2155843.1 putative spermidine/putrescine transport system permease protein [Erwinia rhapontici]MCS3606121.1 putative spermidine/putrescine transport system permease protein [Erwinia rhapontici]NKG30488.1 ABC transporter permease [Erwinia rhapontici]NNS05747.1 ABC transporter permease [Erwinia sp. JH02]
MLNRRENPVPGLLYKLFVYGFGSLCVIYLVAPIVIALMMSFTSGQTLKYPPQGFSLRWYEALLDPVRSATEHVAAGNSLKIAALAVLGALIFAVPATIGMTRMKRRNVSTIEPLLLAPLVLPSLVYGLAALIVANFIGFPPSLWLTILGHVVVFGPLMYRAVSVVAQGMNPSLAEASATMGASWFMTLRRVTLPLLMPGIMAGAFLVFIQSLDNVSVSLFLADARTTVLPLRMFALIEESLDVRVAAISGILIAITLLGLLVARRVLAPRPQQP